MYLHKSNPVRSKQLRDSARDQDCTIEIPGYCNGNPETTVSCHVQFEGGVMGGKASDLSICHGCNSCHDVIDGRVQAGLSREELGWYKTRAVLRTLERLAAMGLISIKGVRAA